VNILLVGLGRWGESHLRVLSELGVTVWALDLSAERRAWAAKTGLDPSRIASDLAAVLPQVDAVDIVTPAETHLVELVAATGRLLQVGHIFRFHPVTDVLRRCLREGRVGQVRYLAGRFAGFKRPRTDVGVTQTDAIHYFDLFSHLLGRGPTAVTATLRDFLGRGLDDLAAVTVEYGEVPAFVEAGYFAPGTFRDCVVVGDGAALVADFGQSLVTILDQRHQWRDGQWVAREGDSEELKVSGEEPLKGELQAFVGAVAGGRPPSVDVRDGLLALRVVEAAQLSSRLGRRVTLEEV
jgi:UDP-N-acetylglucosamine 3-dehydrogenase